MKVAENLDNIVFEEKLIFGDIYQETYRYLYLLTFPTPKSKSSNKNGKYGRNFGLKMFKSKY